MVQKFLDTQSTAIINAKFDRSQIEKRIKAQKTKAKKDMYRKQAFAAIFGKPA